MSPGLSAPASRAPESFAKQQNKTKQNSYSYFKVAIYIQAQQGGAMQQPEQTHHWSGALAQPCGSYSSWGRGDPTCWQEECF